MDKPYEVILPVLAFLLVLAALRFGYGTVVDEVRNQPPAFPTSQPFVSPVCGPNNRNCSWQAFDTNWQQPPPQRGLMWPEPPR
jgi:hypothetical protein